MMVFINRLSLSGLSQLPEKATSHETGTGNCKLQDLVEGKVIVVR